MNVQQEQLKHDILDYFSIHHPNVRIQSLKTYLRTKYSSKLKISSKWIKQIALQYTQHLTQRSAAPPRPPQHIEALHHTQNVHKTKHSSISKPSKRNKNRILNQNTNDLMMECFGSPLKSLENSYNAPSAKKQTQINYETTPDSLAVYGENGSTTNNDNDSISINTEFKCNKCAKIFDAVTTKLRHYYTFSNQHNYNHHQTQHQMHAYNPYFCFLCRVFRCNEPQSLLQHIQSIHSIPLTKQWKKPATLRQKRPRQSGISMNQQPQKRMKLNHTVQHNVTRPHQTKHLSLPFNQTHMKTLPSNKEDINVQNVMKDVANMQCDYTQNQHQNHYTNNIHNPVSYNSQRRNNQHNIPYAMNPHIVPFEAQYIHVVQREFGTLLDNTQTNHVRIVYESSVLKESLSKLDDGCLPPYYQMPLVMSNDPQYILLYSPWYQLWIYGINQFRQQILQQLSATINVNYGVLKHDALYFGMRPSHSTNWRNHRMHNNYNPYRNNPSYQAQQRNNINNMNHLKNIQMNNATIQRNNINNISNMNIDRGREGNVAIYDTNVDELYPNTIDQTDITDNTNSTPVDVPSIQIPENESIKSSVESHKHLHSQISPYQSYVIPNKLKLENNRKFYPLQTPAFVPAAAHNENAMPLLNIMSKQQNTPHESIQNEESSNVKHFTADRFGEGDIIPTPDAVESVKDDTPSHPLIEVMEQCKPTEKQKQKNEKIKENLNDTVSVFVNLDVEHSMNPKSMKIRQKEENNKEWTKKREYKRQNGQNTRNITHKKDDHRRNINYNVRNDRCNAGNDRYNEWSRSVRNRSNEYHYNYKKEHRSAKDMIQKPMTDYRSKRHERRDKTLTDRYRRTYKRNRKYSDNYSSSDDYSYSESMDDGHSQRRHKKRKYKSNKYTDSETEDYDYHRRSKKKKRKKHHKDKVRQHKKKYKSDKLGSNAEKKNDLNISSNTKTVSNTTKKTQMEMEEGEVIDSDLNRRSNGYKPSKTHTKIQKNNTVQRYHKAASNRTQKQKNNTTKSLKSVSHRYPASNTTQKKTESNAISSVKAPIQSVPKAIEPNKAERIETLKQNINGVQSENEQPIITKLDHGVQDEDEDEDESSSDENLFDMVTVADINEDNIDNGIKEKASTNSSLDTAQIGHLCDLIDPMLRQVKGENEEHNTDALNVEMKENESLGDEALFGATDIEEENPIGNNNDEHKKNESGSEDEELFGEEKTEKYDIKHKSAASMSNTNTHTMSHFLDVSKTPHMRPIARGRRESPFKAKVLVTKKPQNGRNQTGRKSKTNTKVNKKRKNRIKNKKESKKNNKENLIMEPPPMPLRVESDDMNANENNEDDDTFTRFWNDDSNNGNDEKLKAKPKSKPKPKPKPKPLLFGGLNVSDSDSEDSSEEDELLFAKELKGIQTKHISNLPKFSHAKNATNFGHFCTNK